MSHSTPTPDAPQQIHLRLFAWIDSARGRVPERALWRETIDLAILTAEATAFVVHGRKIAVAVVHHLAWVIYSLTNSAGLAHASDEDLAQHAHLRDPKMVSRALIILNRIHAVRSTRDSRRTKRIHAMNLGGLSWPAIRQRARLRRTVEAAYGGQQLPLPDYPSGGNTPPLSGGNTPPLRGVRTLGVKISDPIAVADPPRRREAADQQKQQQQPNTINDDNDKSHDERDEHRINGLIAYLAVTFRRKGARFNEGTTRENIAAGRTTVLDLQAQADQIRAEDDQIRRDAHDSEQRRRRPDEEHEERAGYVDDDEAPQDHEQAASATPAPGAEPEEPGQARDALQDPDPLAPKCTPAATNPGDHPTDTPQPAPPAERKQEPSASGAGPRPVHDGDDIQPHPAESARVEPAEPPDPSALRATFDLLTGRKHKWRDRP